MNVYVESNFVLELALLQEEHEACESLLVLSAGGKVHLILPAFSIAEPYETLARRGKTRNQLAQNVGAELRQLGRSKPYKTEIDAYQAITGLLLRSGVEEQERLSQTRDRLLRTAEVIPLDRGILASAATMQIRHGLSPQDSLVYASVLQHLAANDAEPSCFLNKNWRDFSDPDIEDALKSYNCKLFLSFDRAYHYIEAQV